MINVSFLISDNTFIGFDVSGHAGYRDSGEDIVCAAVTSAVEMCANGITEILKVNANISVKEANVKLVLPNNSPLSAVDFIKALRIHLEILSKDYPKNIVVNNMEV